MKLVLCFIIAALAIGLYYEASKEPTNVVWVKLLTVANKMNRKLPQQQDRWIRADKIIVGPKKELTYFYTVVIDELDESAFKKIKSNLDYSYEYSSDMKYFRENNVAVHKVYLYEDSDKTVILSTNSGKITTTKSLNK